VSTVQDFLGLSEQDMAVIEARLALAKAVKQRRLQAGMTQAQLAKMTHSRQARVAKMECGDPQASIESLIRALGATGSRVKLTVKRGKRAA